RFPRHREAYDGSAQIEAAGLDTVKVSRHGAGGVGPVDAAHEVERFPVVRERRVVLVVCGVYGRSKVARRAPHAVAQMADVEVAQAVAAGPQGGEDQRAAVRRDLRVELPGVLQPFAGLAGGLGVDGVAQLLPGPEACAIALGGVDVPVLARLRRNRTAGEVQGAVRAGRGVQLVVRAVHFRPEADGLAPSRFGALYHPEVQVAAR